MNILLDTHAVIWFITEDSQLTQKTKREIENPDKRQRVSKV